MSFFDLFTGGASKKARRAYDDALGEYEGIDLPELEMLRLQGLDGTAYDDIQADPKLRAAQMAALQQLEERAALGLSATDRATLYEIEQDQLSTDRGARDAITGNMARRGTLGSGNELAAKLIAQQGAAGRATQRGMEVASMSQRAREGAMRDLLSGAGSVRGQDYQEAARRAEAADAIARFNAGVANTATTWNTTQRPQQMFSNEMGLAGAKAGIHSAKAGNYTQEGNRNQAMIGGLINTGATLGGAAIGGPAGGKVAGTIASGAMEGTNSVAAGPSAPPLPSPALTQYDPDDPMWRYS